MAALQAAIESRVEKAEANAKADVARRLAEPLAAIVNRLSDKDAIFRDSNIGNLREICDLMPALWERSKTKFTSLYRERYSKARRPVPALWLPIWKS
jgi:hypothetical protein